VDPVNGISRKIWTCSMLLLFIITGVAINHIDNAVWYFLPILKDVYYLLFGEAWTIAGFQLLHFPSLLHSRKVSGNCVN